MSDLKQTGEPIEIFGETYYMLFTASVIDALQDEYDKHINDIVKGLDPENRSFYKDLAKIIHTLCAEYIEIQNYEKKEITELTLKRVKQFINTKNALSCAMKILAAFAQSLPKADADDTHG